MTIYVCTNRKGTFVNRKIFRAGDELSFKKGVIKDGDVNWKSKDLIEKEHEEAVAKRQSFVSSGKTVEEVAKENEHLKESLAEMQNGNPAVDALKEELALAKAELAKSRSEATKAKNALLKGGE